MRSKLLSYLRARLARPSAGLEVFSAQGQKAKALSTPQPVNLQAPQDLKNHREPGKGGVCGRRQ